jgi:hypothetical protein
MKNTLYHICKYNRRPEDEPSGLKNVEDSEKLNFNLENMGFVGLYCITLQSVKTAGMRLQFREDGGAGFSKALGNSHQLHGVISRTVMPTVTHRESHHLP